MRSEGNEDESSPYDVPLSTRLSTGMMWAGVGGSFAISAHLILQLGGVGFEAYLYILLPAILISTIGLATRGPTPTYEPEKFVHPHLLDSDESVARSDFPIEDRVEYVKTSAEWLTNQFETGRVEPGLYKKKMWRLEDIAGPERSEIRSIRKQALDQYQAEKTREEREEEAEKRELIQERVESGEMLGTTEIEEVVKELIDEGDVEVFRVVNLGPAAAVGVKAGSGWFDYWTAVLIVDLAEFKIVSIDKFEAANAKQQRTNAQKKLDTIEGIQADRQPGESVFEALADSQQIQLDLLPGDSDDRQSSPRSGLGNKLIGASKKASDIGSGDWVTSPKCPNCGSQQVGKENENAYQCRQCGKMIHTGVDITFDE